MQVVVGYKSRPKVRQLTDSLNKLGKCVRRGRRLAIVKSVVQNPSMRPYVISVLSSEARKEIKFLSSRNHDSILRMKTKDSLERFSWDIEYGWKLKQTVHYLFPFSKDVFLQGYKEIVVLFLHFVSVRMFH